ncbi:MAG: hypothetical protein Rubg2KO_19500 [Rubricoccaceae bacterium]
MNIWLNRLLIVLVAPVILLSCDAAQGGAPAALPGNSEEQLQSEIDRLNQEIERLGHENVSHKQQIKRLKSDLDLRGPLEKNGYHRFVVICVIVLFGMAGGFAIDLADRKLVNYSTSDDGLEADMGWWSHVIVGGIAAVLVVMWREPGTWSAIVSMSIFVGIGGEVIILSAKKVVDEKVGLEVAREMLAAHLAIVKVVQEAQENPNGKASEEVGALSQSQDDQAKTLADVQANLIQGQIARLNKRKGGG